MYPYESVSLVRHLAPGQARFSRATLKLYACIATFALLTLARRHTGPALLLLLKSRAQVPEHTELLQKDRYCDVAVEGHDLSVLQMKYVAAWGVNFLVRRRNHSGGQHEVSVVRTVQGELCNHDVVVEIKVVDFAMHVRESGGINVHGDSDFFSVVLLSCTHVIEIATFCEVGHKVGRVFCCGFGRCV